MTKDYLNYSRCSVMHDAREHEIDYSAAFDTKATIIRNSSIKSNMNYELPVVSMDWILKTFYTRQYLLFYTINY